MNKAVDYFTRSANQNYSYAQQNLGLLYYNSSNSVFNIEKAIYYLTLAANQNLPDSQYYLGLIFYNGKYIPPKIDKAVYYLLKSAENHHSDAACLIGCLYHEGLYTETNIEKAIHFYKIASSLNNEYAKNNLAIIYKYGFGDVKKKIAYSIELLKEAINQKQFALSMYNLAIILIFEDIKKNQNQIIDLLSKSSKEFFQSEQLLNYLEKYNFDPICAIKFNLYFEQDFICFYDRMISSSNLNDEKIQLKKRKKMLSTKQVHNINEFFYEGLGNDL